MKKSIIIILIFLVGIVNGLEYTGNNELVVRNIYGNQTSLTHNENLSLSSDKTYYLTLQPLSHSKNLRSAIDYLMILVNGLLFGIVLIAGTYILIKMVVY